MKNYELIGSGVVVIGKNVSIGEDVKFIAPEGTKISIGDYATLGDGVKIVIESGDVCIGDWTTLHSNCLLLSTLGLEIGQHCWFGQNTVLDGTGSLIIKNGVRVGMFSQIWTHVAAGEQIEGCTLIGTNPVLIEDDAWLVGTCTVGSGVKIGKRAICMNGSNVTKSVIENTVVAGLPAKIRKGLNFYKDITLDEKFKLLINWLEEFVSKNKEVAINTTSNTKVILTTESEIVTFYKYRGDYDGNAILSNESQFEIETKKYSKSFIKLEQQVMKFLSGNKARFYSES